MGLFANLSDAVAIAKRRVQSIKINPKWLWLFQKIVFFYLVISYVLPILFRSDHAHSSTAVTPNASNDGMIAQGAAQFWICQFVQCAFAQTTSAQYVMALVALQNVTGVLDVVAETSNQKNLFVVGGGDYCFKKVVLNDALQLQVTGRYGETTLLTNNCVNLVLNKAKTLAVIADNKGGGLLVVNPGTLQPIGQLSNFNAEGVALSDDEKYAYVLRNGPQGPEILIANVTDPKNPALVGLPIKVPRQQDQTRLPTDYNFLLKIKLQQDNLWVVYNYWDGGSSPSWARETGLCRYPLQNPANLNTPVCQVWKKPLWGVVGGAGTNTAIVPNIHFSLDGKKIFTAIASRLVKPSTSYPDVTDPPRGVITLDNTNSTALNTMREYFSALKNPVNDVAFFPDEKTAIVADSEGIKFINFDQLFLTDPPVVTAQWNILGGVAKIFLEGDLLIAKTTAGQVQVFSLQPLITVPVNTILAKPIFLAKNDRAELIVNQPNKGKIVVFENPTGAGPAQITQLTIQTIKLIDAQQVENNLPSWIVVNNTTGEFSINPPKNILEKSITLRFTVNGKSSDTTFPIVKNPGAKNTRTQSRSLLPPTSAPTSAPTTNAPVTAAQTIAPTPAQTELQTQTQRQTPAPTTTNAPPVATFPVDPFNPSSQPSPAPGVTASPNALQIATVNSKLTIQAATTSSEITFVALLQANLDSFKESSVASLGVIPSYRNGLLQLTGSVDDVNKALTKLSLSSSDNDPQRIVKVAVSSDGGNSWVRTQATLSDFEKNHAPTLMNATINYANQTVPLDSPFSISLKSLFTDSDGDSLQYVLQGAPDWVSLRNGVISGRSSTEGIFSFTAYATDGAAKSESVTVTLTNQDMLPTIDASLVAKTLSVKAGVQKDFYPIPRNAAKTIGEKTCIVTLADGSDLPPGIKWDADFWKLTVYGDALVNYSLKFTVQDIYQRETSVIIPLSIVDAAPIAHPEKVPTITALAEKEKKVDFPNAVITDSDDSLSALTFTLSPKYSWAEFSKSSGKLLLSVTPPKSAVGQCLVMMLRAFDGYLSDAVNITVCVPPHIPPVVNVTLPDKTVITGQKVEYRIPKNAFASDYPLTYSAAEIIDDKAVNTELNVNDDLVFSVEAMQSENVGKKRIRITATDPVGGKTPQEFTLTIDFSEWENIKYWLARIGAPVGILITGLGFVWTIKEFAGPAISCLRGNVEKKSPFVWDAESQRYEYCIKQHKPGDYKIRYKMAILGERKLSSKVNPVVAVAGFFSSYWRKRIIDEVLEKDWIKYDGQRSTVFIAPAEVPGDASPVRIQILKYIPFCFEVNFVLEEFWVDPNDFRRDIDMRVRQPASSAAVSAQASLEEPLLAVPKKQDSEDNNSLGLTTSSDEDSKNRDASSAPKNNPLQKSKQREVSRDLSDSDEEASHAKQRYLLFANRSMDARPPNPNSKWLPKGCGETAASQVQSSRAKK